MSDLPNGNFINVITVGAVSLAAVIGIGITVLQSDTIGRKYLLSSEQLRERRNIEYQYKWQQSLTRTEIKLNQYFNTHHKFVSNNNGEEEIIIETVTDYILLTADEIKDFVLDKILRKKTTNNNKDSSSTCIVRIGRIGIDRSKHATDVREHFIWLYVTESSNNTTTVYQIPVILFGTIAAEVFETYYMFTGTYCFIADASANVGSNVICNLLQTAFKGSTETNILVLQQQYWLLCYTILYDQNIYSKENLIKVLYSLFRIEAIRLLALQPQNQQQDGNTKIRRSNATIVVPIPGTLVPILLPILQETFPSDRHIFVYTGCCNIVEYALQQTRNYRFTTKLPLSFDDALSFHNSTVDVSKNNNTTNNNSTTNDPVFYTIPIKLNYLHKSINVNRSKLPTAMATVPVSIAAIIETWMSSIDMFFQLKYLEIENRIKKVKKKSSSSKNRTAKQSPFTFATTTTTTTNTTEKEPDELAYIPYVCKIDFLLNYDNNTNSSFAYGSNEYWSLRSLLQYCTGKQNREISSECMDAAISWLQDYCTSSSKKKNQSSSSHQLLDPTTKKYIENIVFQHKLILIGDKTLQDTVLPSQHWALFNSNGTKSGCACCGPEDDDDDEDDEVVVLKPTTTTASQSVMASSPFAMVLNNTNTTTTTPSNNTTTTFGIPSTTQQPTSDQVDDRPPPEQQQQQQSQQQLYLDGRSGFAFDPNRFK